MIAAKLPQTTVLCLLYWMKMASSAEEEAGKTHTLRSPAADINHSDAKVNAANHGGDHHRLGLWQDCPVTSAHLGQSASLVVLQSFLSQSMPVLGTTSRRLPSLLVLARRSQAWNGMGLDRPAG